jgi:hypothetical protein
MKTFSKFKCVAHRGGQKSENDIPVSRSFFLILNRVRTEADGQTGWDPSKHLVWTDKWPINDDVRCPFYLLFIFQTFLSAGKYFSRIYILYNISLDAQNRREYRVPGILSSRPNWVPPPPHQQGSVDPSPLDPRKETHSFAGEGVRGGPIPTKGLSLWYSMYTISPLYAQNSFSLSIRENICNF